MHRVFKACSPSKINVNTILIKPLPPSLPPFLSLTRYILFSLLDDDQVEHTQVAVYDAPTDRSPSPISLATRSEAGVTLLEEQLDTAVGEDTLLHWKTLFIIATRDTDNIALCRGENGYVNP